MVRTLEKKPNKIGRPRLPENTKKQRVSLSVGQNTLALVDNIRGDVPRSEYIEDLIISSHNTDLPQKDKKKKNGIFYTPSSLADFVALKAIKFISTETPKKIFNNNLRILDPACGDGVLLKSTWKYLCYHTSSSYPLNAYEILCGIDIEKKAASRTQKEIASLTKDDNNGNPKVCVTNALYPFNYSLSEKGWQRIKKTFNSQSGFDLIIANPPWGADTSLYRNKLLSGEYKLSKGQYDTSDLFIERAIKIAKRNGHIAFIVPDSLFAQERLFLRELLAKETQIQFIGRFGEKIFNNVNRACAVIICKKARPSDNHKVECLRLNKESRTNILNGTSTFKKECDAHSHLIPQTRFLGNENHIFDIDLNKDEEFLLRKFNSTQSVFGDYLESCRGVELSKSGKICKCISCRKWLPVPASKNPTCPHCKNELKDWDSTVLSIVEDEGNDSNVPFIVGESISRYFLQKNRWIITGYEGINYKHNMAYSPPKIVVRKTGIGISASIDYSNAYTNQVVYIFRKKENIDSLPILPIEFFLGVLNSRVIYYYLAKTYGETEWRSHPYVTQKQISNFPLPSIKSIQDEPTTVEKIAKLVRLTIESNKTPESSVDAEIERLVANLYGLKEKDYQIIFKSIEDSEGLLPIRALKKITLFDIFKNRK